VAEDTIENISGHLNIKPRISIHSPSLSGTIPEWVQSVDGVQDVALQGDNLLITCEVTERLRILNLLQDRGLDVRDFKTVEPSLEEAFVRLLSGKEES
jgi:ABC-2 type transport system ATP-binding protein